MPSQPRATTVLSDEFADEKDSARGTMAAVNRRFRPKHQGQAIVSFSGRYLFVLALLLAPSLTKIGCCMVPPLSHCKSFHQRTASHLASSSQSDWFANNKEPPYLAIVTEPTVCDSTERMNETLRALQLAMSTGRVSLICVRPIPSKEFSRDYEARVVNFTRSLVALAAAEETTRIVVSSDAAAARTAAHGIHVKERDRHLIPAIRKETNSRNLLIGTSAHSVESAVEAANEYQVDYVFVGTCYPTLSHPEKQADDLEGPSLPGRVCKALEQQLGKQRPVVFAIGGIHAGNCHEPVVAFGADGVATIRAVLQSTNPAATAEQMYQNMKMQEGMESVAHEIVRW